MTQVAQRHPRTWVLWMVRAVLALTVLILGVGSISTIWLGKATGSFWWLIMSLPQVSIALLAVLLCWSVDSRPERLGLTAGLLNGYGMIGGLAFMKWLPLLIGALTILAMLTRPRDWPYSEPPPSPTRMAAAVTSPFAGRSPWVVDPDFTIWVPALRPVELEGGDLDLEAWAAKIAGSSWAEGITPDPDDYERIRKLLLLVGSQDFPSFDPWQDKWIHYPDRDDMPLPVMISDYDFQDNGNDDELRAYLRVGDPLVIEEPIVEEVHTAMGRGLRGLAYSPLHEQGKVNICATLAYVWRVETEDDLSITRLWAMYDPTRILKAADDIHALAMTLRLREQ